MARTPGCRGRGNIVEKPLLLAPASATNQELRTVVRMQTLKQITEPKDSNVTSKIY